MAKQLYVFIYDGFNAFLHIVGSNMIVQADLLSAIEAITNLNNSGWEQTIRAHHVLPIQNKIMNPACHVHHADQCSEVLRGLNLHTRN